jgi:glycosyltransferase involved in cell wall biosynthesis
MLAAIPNARQVTSFMVERELQGYRFADRISVPSAHVVESFARSPDHARKLFLNPLGVDIDQFPLRRNAPRERSVLYVGQWSYRKGVDILADAMSTMDGVRVIHVGAAGDAPFPNHQQFSHYGHVSQEMLKHFYEVSSVFALASREDGFGCVLPQALCSGLPVVCTDRTGGPDLVRAVGLSRLIRIVPAGNVTALRVALKQALEDAAAKANFLPITAAERQMLSWKRYAMRELQLVKWDVEHTQPHDPALSDAFSGSLGQLISPQ